MNQLLVDVQIREVIPNIPPIFQTNNGVFSLVGSFSIGEGEYVSFSFQLRWELIYRNCIRSKLITRSQPAWIFHIANPSHNRLSSP